MCHIINDKALMKCNYMYDNSKLIALMSTTVIYCIIAAGSTAYSVRNKRLPGCLRQYN